MPPRGVKKGTKRARRARSGQSRTRSRSSTRGASPSKEQLYKQARRLRISGRSSMSKAQLQRAVARKKS